MATVAVLISDFFEDSEYTRPAKAFKENGHHLVHIGLERNTIVKSKKEQTPVTIDESVTSANINSYDALLIPGGYSPDRLRAYDSAVKIYTRLYGIS